MKLTAFKYGVTTLPESMAFKGGNKEKELPISLLFFLAETENKKILIDVGCDTMPGFLLTEFKKPVEVLEDYGIKKEEITDVFLTHAHHDHIDCVHYYENANIHLHKDAYEMSKNYLKNNKNVFTFENEVHLAQGVCGKYIGGHEKGSSIVIIENGNDIYVLCGDECYTKENLAENKLTGSSVCPEKSMAFLEEYRKDKYKTILFHAPDVVKTIGFEIIC